MVLITLRGDGKLAIVNENLKSANSLYGVVSAAMSAESAVAALLLSLLPVHETSIADKTETALKTQSIFLINFEMIARKRTYSILMQQRSSMNIPAVV